ncbi:hypothetical protein Ana3638_11825 [Anaerocolumna sedimenticola]|uniref:Uncharacterized protein n=1 Tax=Anaerocolumna sedimenticola TaxID=2696063 RepID=A0A6P1TNI7_9FIRM|nr:hypothetical protein [Anaerocolumna sedimenticola]QHQ61376.1 hypothetical protein Ana3638_11825 [Anaerocolumna sedimenticola]
MPKESNKKPIPVIASFNKEGQIMPIYIQVEVAPIKLLEVTYCNEYADHYFYRVSYVLHNFLMDAYLYYYFDKHVWMIEE